MRRSFLRKLVLSVILFAFRVLVEGNPLSTEPCWSVAIETMTMISSCVGVPIYCVYHMCTKCVGFLPCEVLFRFSSLVAAAAASAVSVAWPGTCPHLASTAQKLCEHSLTHTCAHNTTWINKSLSKPKPTFQQPTLSRQQHHH